MAAIAGTASQASEVSGLTPDNTNPLQFIDADGTTVTLNASSPIVVPCSDGYQIKIQLLNAAALRFSVSVLLDNEIIRRVHYSAERVLVSAGLLAARRWIRQQQARERLLGLFSGPTLILWFICSIAAWFLHPVIGWIAYLPLLVSMPASWFFVPRRHGYGQSTTACLAGLKWDLNDFCRGWLITGDTGSGKTYAINLLMHSVFQHHPDWGGICCNEKGIYHETLTRMAARYGREHDLVLLQTRPNHADHDWKPPARFNLLSDLTIPASTYATAIVDTASALASGSEDKGFFKTQAHVHIGQGIQLFRLLSLTPTMHHLLEVLQHQQILKAMLQQLEPLKDRGEPGARECYDHFLTGYLRQPAEQLGGVISTISNYLSYFTNPDIVEVFGAETNSFEFAALDEGAIICISMPQKYQTERRYIMTLLKLLFYNHALRRFDPRAKDQRSLEEDNLLICWQDEAQRFITESDCNVDILRQARTTTVMATQSKTSFLPALGSRDKADVTTLNLRNRVIFKAADRSCAETSADFIGKKMIWKKSYTRGRGSTSVTRTREEEYLIKPYELMSLPKFAAVIKHCDNRFQKRALHPIEPDGTRPAWYAWWRPLLT
jgi:TraM recognition site of TraD and TraG